MKLKSILSFLASLKLAVLVVIAIGVLSAWGTIVEAQYNSAIALKVVYKSVYMVTALTALTINLIAVIVDRYPWKKHHLGFILAHVGIITLIFGSVLTHQFGVDGSMAIVKGQSRSAITVPLTDLVVWGSFDGTKWAKLLEKEVDFYKHPPSEKKPVTLPVGAEQIQVVNYIPFAFEERKIVASTKAQSGPALRFQLINQNVNLTQWIQLARLTDAPSIMNLGPAKVILHAGDYKPTEENQIILQANKDKDYLSYKIYSSRLAKFTEKGDLKAGQVVETGWMGLQLRALKLIPQAEESISFIAQERPTEITRSAIQVQYAGERYWLGQDSQLQFFSEQAAFIVGYGGRKIDLGFAVKLDDFRVGRYQGTMRAATYESDVIIDGLGKINISMNEPLKHAGYTFYQASFNDEDPANPVSILSVNKDPGRWVKYLGSLIMTIGVIVLFYFKKSFSKKAKV